MFRNFAAALLIFTAVSGQGWAHSEGHGIIDAKIARVTAVGAAGYFTVEDVGKPWGLLPTSWRGLSISQAELIAEVDGDFVVGVTNPETDELLYILVGSEGSVLDANFTGSFPYVWDKQSGDRAVSGE